MADIRVRNIPDWVVDWYKLNATKNGKTLEGYMRQKLTAAVLEHQASFADELANGVMETETKYGILPDSTPLLHEVREE